MSLLFVQRDACPSCLCKGMNDPLVCGKVCQYIDQRDIICSLLNLIESSFFRNYPCMLVGCMGNNIFLY